MRYALMISTLTLTKVLGVIPARGGSKRVPRKNLRTLCGKPLIQYTLEAADRAASLTTVVVSTEDYEIGQVAAVLGAYVVRRPDDLASDSATTGAVLKHALDWLDGDHEYVVCLHPTSPIRDPRHIDEMVEIAVSEGLRAVYSVQKLPRKTHATVGFENSWVSGAVMLNASVYVLHRDYLEAQYNHTDPYFGRPYEMDRFHSLDIDDEIDFKLAELYMEHLKNGNGEFQRLQERV